MRRLVAFGLSLVLWAGASSAQTSGTSSATGTESEGKHSGAPLAQFNAGPFIVTPTFRIGTLAVDTNVQYSKDRRADFVASAGPGLDIAVPFQDNWKIDLEGTSEYFYFQRTTQLRRWTGGGRAGLFYKSIGTRANLSTRFNRDYSRPSFEVDTRVASDQRNFSLDVERDLGRLTLRAQAFYFGTRVGVGQEFRGADLATALTTDRYHGGGEFRYRLTPVTSLIAEGAYEQTRFPVASIRNYYEESGGLGLQMDGLLKGRATAGLRRTALVSGSVSKVRPYFRANLLQNFGGRFKLSERYSHDSTVSAFAVDGDLPTFERRTLDLELSVRITRRIDMRFGGTRDRTLSDGLVQVVLDDGSLGQAKRNDVAYVGRADLGMKLGRARTSIFVSYTTRKSEFFRDFGIDGLQAGARVEYSPDSPRR